MKAATSAGTAAASAIAVLLTAGCTAAASPATSPVAHSASPVASPAAPPSPAAQPVTARAAHAAAVTYFSLYAARQYAAVWPLLTPAARRDVTQRAWVAIHDRCEGATAGLAYKVGHATLAGRTAVMAVSLAGALSKIGSEEEAFTYTSGRWSYAPSDLSVYQGHTVAEAVAAAKARQLCG